MKGVEGFFFIPGLGLEWGMNVDVFCLQGNANLRNVDCIYKAKV